MKHIYAAIIAIVASVPAIAEPPEYKIELLGPAWSIADINASGVAVGGNIDPITAEIRAWAAGPTHPYQQLPLPPGYTKSRANGINDVGVIVGAVALNGYPNEHGDAAVWTPDGQGGYTVEVLGHLPGDTGSVARAINNRGDIIGTSIYSNSGFGPSVWFNSPDGILNIATLGAPNAPPAINDNGLVVGYAASPFDIDTLQSVPYPPGLLGGTALLDVNNSNEFAGYAIPSCQCIRFAVRYTEELGWEQIGASVNPSAPVAAWGMNNHGDVVGDMTGPAVHTTEFGTRSLESILTPGQGLWGFASIQGAAINDNGQIAAYATNFDTQESGVAVLTPLGTMIIPGDVNGNAIVDLDDHCAWTADPIDLNDDGVINADDEQWLLDLLAELGFFVMDCNANGLSDHCDILDDLSPDCDGNDVPDECQTDCNANGIADACEPDCNANGIADECDISQGTSDDCNANGIPDECDIGGVTQAVNILEPPIFVPFGGEVANDLIVTDVGIVDDVDFSLDIDYRIGYLTVLLSHNGTTVTLIDKPGDPEGYGGYGHVGYVIVLDDEGTGEPIEDAGEFGSFEEIVSPPSYTPNNPLSAFDGMPVEGTWTVHVITATGYSPVSSFHEWGLSITRAPADIPDPCVCPGDLDGSGAVGLPDLLALLIAWGECDLDCPEDLDGNGTVNATDLLALLSKWGACP